MALVVGAGGEFHILQVLEDVHVLLLASVELIELAEHKHRLMVGYVVVPFLFGARSQVGESRAVGEDMADGDFIEEFSLEFGVGIGG